MEIAAIFTHWWFSLTVIIPKSMCWRKETKESVSELLSIHPAIHLVMRYLLNIECIQSICFIQISGEIVWQNFEDSAGLIYVLCFVFVLFSEPLVSQVGGAMTLLVSGLEKERTA